MLFVCPALKFVALVIVLPAKFPFRARPSSSPRLSKSTTDGILCHATHPAPSAVALSADLHFKLLAHCVILNCAFEVEFPPRRRPRQWLQYTLGPHRWIADGRYARPHGAMRRWHGIRTFYAWGRGRLFNYEFSVEDLINWNRAAARADNVRIMCLLFENYS